MTRGVALSVAAVREGARLKLPYDELLKGDKLNLDLFWSKDESITEPDELAAEVTDNPQTALELFSTIAKSAKV